MNLNWINQVGDWNPQLLRELKGRLKPRNLILSAAISLLGQFLLFMYFQTQLPNKLELVYSPSHKYCTGTPESFHQRKCLVDEFGDIIINWQLWYLDVFTWLSIIGCFTLLTAGAYLIINDLASEEKRETLNFIRLSPQSPQSILSGKMLGVPILLFIGLLLAIPLHLLSALAGKIPLAETFSFYIVVVAACILFYSAALLFGLVGSWLGGFQSWLGAGVVLCFLIVTMRIAAVELSDDYPLVFARLINPTYLIPDTAISSTFSSVSARLINFQWFSLSVGDSLYTTLGFTLIIYGLGTYCIWQSLNRCFRDPNTTMLSKRQSYLLTACYALITLGLANWSRLVLESDPGHYKLAENLVCLLFLDFWLFLYLIAALNPHRQTLQDWARYRRTARAKGLVDSRLVQDLIWGEKSPGLIAIAINAIIASVAISGLVLLSQYSASHKLNALFALVLSVSLAMVYAALAQLLLFTKNHNRVFWSAATVGTAIILPVIIVAIFTSSYRDNNFLWLYSIIGPIFAISPDGKYLSPITALLPILSYWTMMSLLVFQLRRNLVKAGESATKAMLAGK
ncbi:hypothetical protein H6G41_19620 [Tolypothrix sp. FACHB-123]|uniref:hypothetical protein n=1 Tax=Tolypothrix sp. FACHB-123 TaxID=2692868 RepID=UPI001683EDCE|nr:hypothetical protein [Tolypothrix sp. FACHB-123]MBD2356808.1 hypothetical protein [Tolypothrix sp. FACHB-123]